MKSLALVFLYYNALAVAEICIAGQSFCGKDLIDMGKGNRRTIKERISNIL